MSQAVRALGGVVIVGGGLFAAQALALYVVRCLTIVAVSHVPLVSRRYRHSNRHASTVSRRCSPVRRRQTHRDSAP
jgi:hypothetical protein